VNAASEGKVYPAVEVEVDARRLKDFRAVFDQAEGVPPTFVTTIEYLAFAQVVDDDELGLDFARVLHGAQEFVHHRPVREGETVTATIRIDSIRAIGDNGFIVVVTDIVDEDGDLVCVAKSTMVERGSV
jgi:N-terminal half of MaoC dehydratase